MNKRPKNQKGFTLLEVIIIILVLVVICGVGYMVYNNNHDTKTSSSSISSSEASKKAHSLQSDLVGASEYPVYKTSTVPSDWDTYTSTAYGFSISYPSGWTQSNTDKSSTIYASDANINFFDIEFGAPNTTQNTTAIDGYEVTVTNQSLSQTLTADENVLVNDNTSSGSAVTAKVLDEKYYTFKGDNAIQLDTESFDNSNGSTNYNTDFIVYKNGNTYDLFSQDDTKNIISNPTYASALASLAIQ